MYIKKHHKKILDLCDQKQTLPRSFKRFVERKERVHNLVIKGKNNHLYCTCCSFEFVAQTCLNNVIKCPNCKQKLTVRSSRLKYHIFKDTIQLLDKIDNVLVLRTYELASYYSNKKFTHHLIEFMRTIIEDNKTTDFLTNNVYNYLGFLSIKNCEKFTHWHKSSSPYSCLGLSAMVSPYNIKSVLKGTKLEFSGLEKLVSKFDYMFFLDYYFIAQYRSFELLIKLGLYKLSMDADKFFEGNSFQTVFGVPKTFYKFMKKNNIDYKQLKVLRLIKKEDISLINKLVKINDLEELAEYVDIEEAYYKILCKKENSEYDYLDYLKMAKLLDYPMNNKKVLYPNNLKKEHDKLNKLYKVVKNEKIDKKIKERLEKLNKKTYANDKYIIIVPTSTASLINESHQMNNCVKNYSEDFGLGKKDIYFMREINKQNKSLITVEVRNNKIVQARIRNNELPNKMQWDFLYEWQDKILSKAN